MSLFRPLYMLLRSLYTLFKALVKFVFYKALAGISFRKWYRFNDNHYKGKRVIVVGPASSSMGYMSGPEIDGFDLVVRINKSPHTVVGREDRLGSRTDVLYHCCDEDPITGGGVLDLNILNDQKTEFVIYTYADVRVEYNFHRVVFKYPYLNLFRANSGLYKSLRRRYKSKMPSTGLQALNHIMSCDFKELHITGFTFFKTPYADGYRDQFQSASDAAALATSSGNHDPDDELRLFKEIYKSFCSHKKILLDSDLKSLLEWNG